VAGSVHGFSMVCFCDSGSIGCFLKTMWISLAKDTWKVAAKPWAVYDFCRMMVAKQSVISGIVRDPNGRPVADARIYFIGGPVPLPDIAALTDAAGAFSLTDRMHCRRVCSGRDHGRHQPWPRCTGRDLVGTLRENDGQTSAAHGFPVYTVSECPYLAVVFYALDLIRLSHVIGDGGSKGSGDGRNVIKGMFNLQALLFQPRKVSPRFDSDYNGDLLLWLGLFKPLQQLIVYFGGHKYSPSYSVK